MTTHRCVGTWTLDSTKRTCDVQLPEDSRSARCPECRREASRVRMLRYWRKKHPLKPARKERPPVPAAHRTRSELVVQCLNNVPCYLIHQAAGFPRAGINSNIPLMLEGLTDDQMRMLVRAR